MTGDGLEENKKEEDDDFGRPFTTRERRRIRRMIRDDDRADWLKGWAKSTLLMAAATVTAVVAIKSGFGEMVKWIWPVRL